ncbi:MAG: hypothetical protein ACTSSH_02265 [Candidatus Heimdallarchaeota archaeon]
MVIPKETKNMGSLLTRTESAIEYFFTVLIGFHENAVGQALVSLEKRGWIHRYRDGFRNVIEFTQPDSERDRRLSCCSDLVSKSLVDDEFLAELESINDNYRQEIAQLEKQIRKGKELEIELNKKVESITDVQLNEFVDNLRVKIDDVFDKRPFKEQIKSEILKFQENLGLDSLDNSDSSVTFERFTDYKGKSVIQGYKEISQK